jgi:hypothetical protein
MTTDDNSPLAQVAALKVAVSRVAGAVDRIERAVEEIAETQARILDLLREQPPTETRYPPAEPDDEDL